VSRVCRKDTTVGRAKDGEAEVEVVLNEIAAPGTKARPLYSFDSSAASIVLLHAPASDSCTETPWRLTRSEV
jgi:hypothetical protein